MGEVYRARDRLGRDAALKVLPAALAQDEDRGSQRANFAVPSVFK